MKKFLFALLAMTLVSQAYSQSDDETIVVIRVLEDIKPEKSQTALWPQVLLSAVTTC